MLYTEYIIHIIMWLLSYAMIFSGNRSCGLFNLAPCSTAQGTSGDKRSGRRFTFHQWNDLELEQRSSAHG